MAFPAVRRRADRRIGVRRIGVRVVHRSGPHPADTMFHASARARYDAALCMYHDQALIPLKALHFEEGVNMTLGLPIVRTAPDHGTAFDIAGQGRADPSSTIAALRMAAARQRLYEPPRRLVAAVTMLSLAGVSARLTLAAGVALRGNGLRHLGLGWTLGVAAATAAVTRRHGRTRRRRSRACRPGTV